MRLWVLGATSHMGNNNRWAREGGVIDEIYVENTYRNPEGNPILYDTVLLDKATQEPNLMLLFEHDGVRGRQDEWRGDRVGERGEQPEPDAL